LIRTQSKHKQIEQVIAEGRVHVLCPAERCTVAVDEDFARARLTLGGSKTLEQFAHIQLNSFVEVSRLGRNKMAQIFSSKPRKGFHFLNFGLILFH